MKAAWIRGRVRLLRPVDTGRVIIDEHPFEVGFKYRQLCPALFSWIGLNWLAVYGLQLRAVIKRTFGEAHATSDTDREFRALVPVRKAF